VIVTIHQPEHLPWLGFFDKARSADLFVVLDTVQFRKNYFQNRNRLRTREGWAWLTMPVRHPLMRPISEIEIDLESPLRRRYLNLIRSHYGNAAYFSRYLPLVADVVRSTEPHLARLNIELLDLAWQELDVRTPRTLASSLDLPHLSGGSEVNRAICRELGATTYVSGRWGRAYLDLDAFVADGIEVVFHEFDHPVYPQLHEPFLPEMSVLDLLMNHGPAARDVLHGQPPRTVPS
jgi:hypothetical protein